MIVAKVFDKDLVEIKNTTEESRSNNKKTKPITKGKKSLSEAEFL